MGTELFYGSTVVFPAGVSAVAFSTASVASSTVGSVVVIMVFVDDFFLLVTSPSFFWIVLMVPRFKGSLGGWISCFFLVVVTVRC